MARENLDKILAVSELGLKNYHLKPVDSAHSNDVYRLSSDAMGSVAYYLKNYSNVPNGLERARSELAAINLLQGRTSVSIPEANLVTGSVSQGIFMIQKELPGKPLSEVLDSVNRNKQRSLVEQSSQVLAEIHQITSDSFGSCRTDGVKFSTWIECFSDNVQEKIDFSTRNRIFGSRGEDFFEKKLATLSTQRNEHPTLIHGDFETRNLLVNPSSLKITGLIDFESARFWRPEWDLTRVEAISFPERPDLSEIFLNFYAAITGNNLTEQKRRIAFYKPFESLHFWVWGWGQGRQMREYIKKDVERVTENIEET